MSCYFVSLFQSTRILKPGHREHINLILKQRSVYWIKQVHAEFYPTVDKVSGKSVYLNHLSEACVS